MRTTLLAAIATVGLVGCVGGIEQGPDPLTSPDGDGNDNGDNPAGENLAAAKQLFDTNVFSIVTAKCSGGACHSETATGATLTRFVATDPAKGWQVATNYQALVGNFTLTAAPILTLVKPGTHKGVVYTADEDLKITAWLQKEVELRNGQTTPPPPGAESLSQASDRVLAEFNGCMTKADFDAANMAAAWGNLGSDEGPCQNCHATGGEGFIANATGTMAWDVISSRKYFFLQYLTVDLLGGPTMAKMMVNETSFRGVSNGQAPHLEHPRFNALNNQGMTALRLFFDTVIAKKAAGTCGAPKPFAL
jgi:hypothetical protein